MKIIKQENIYTIKSFGFTYTTYFKADHKEYLDLLPKMSLQHIVKKVNQNVYGSHVDISYIKFKKIDEFYHINEKELLYLLYNENYDFYVLISKENTINENN